MSKKGSTGSQLARGVLIILISNVVNMFFGIITNLILSKYLSVESYAGIKTYQLYLAYVGILHFGFVDEIGSIIKNTACYYFTLSKFRLIRKFCFFVDSFLCVCYNG